MLRASFEWDTHAVGDHKPLGSAELLEGVELCAVIPMVTETVTTPLTDECLHWAEEAPLRFLRVCSAGCNYRLSRMADTTLVLAAMAVLRRLLLEVLAMPEDEQNTVCGGAHAADELKQYCHPKPSPLCAGAWEIQWHVCLVQLLLQAYTAQRDDAKAPLLTSRSIQIDSVPLADTSVSVLQRLANPSDGTCGVKVLPAAGLTLQVTVLSLQPVTQFQTDLAVTVHMVGQLFDRFLVPADRHRADGGDALQQHPLEALTEYEACAQCAQHGVLHPYTSPANPEEPTFPLDGADSTDSRVHVYSAMDARLNSGAKSSDVLLKHMGVSGDAYFSEVLLRVRLDAGAASRLHERVVKHPAVQPAVAALSWRQPPAVATALQLTLYTLRRLLVIGVANAAHAALMLCSGSTTTVPAHPWAHGQLEGYAAACDAASNMSLSLLMCHRPAAVAGGSGLDEEAAATTAEALWCIGMYCKLRLRGARLLGVSGDITMRGRWLHELRDTISRWERVRQRGKGENAAPHSLEHVLLRLPESEWQRTMDSVRSALD